MSALLSESPDGLVKACCGLWWASGPEESSRLELLHLPEPADQMFAFGLRCPPIRFPYHVCRTTSRGRWVAIIDDSDPVLPAADALAHRATSVVTRDMSVP